MAPLEKIDLIGGNGHWRQILAEEEFKRRREEEEAQHRQELQKASEKKRRQTELAERRRRHQLEEERRWQEEREQKELDAKERERRRRDEEEKARLQKEYEEEERRRRMPKTCETCKGSAKCQDCQGQGHVLSVFLRPRVAEEDHVGQTRMEHGRKHQGCERCGGCSHNMLGDLKQGTGACPACKGQGKIWPVIEEMSPAFKAKTNTSAWQADRTQDLKL